MSYDQGEDDRIKWYARLFRWQTWVIIIAALIILFKIYSGASYIGQRVESTLDGSTSKEP